MNTIISEMHERGEIQGDVYDRLSNSRILFLYDQIDDQLAVDICATLFLKDLEDSKNKITLFINSDGGDIRNVLMIYDMINILRSPIETICVGSATGEAALILAAGTPGMRLATKNALISVCQLTHDSANDFDLTDAKKYLDQCASDNKKMMDIFAKCTSKTVKQVTADFNRRVFMNANQAIKYGIVDHVIGGKYVKRKTTQTTQIVKNIEVSK